MTELQSSGQLKHVEELKYTLDITVPQEDVQQAYQKRLNELTKTVELKGFRKGKVPANVVESKFGKGIRQEVAGQLMETSFQKAIADNSLTVAGTPSIDAEELQKGQPYEFSATFEVYPEITLNKLDGVDVDKTTSEVSDSDINDMINKMLKQQATWASVDRAVKEGDRATFDFEGFMNDEPFDGGSAKDFKLEIGSGQMIPGFEDGLLGLKAGDEKDLKVTFPEAYGVKDLAGKEALFKIKMHGVEEAALPEMNDEFSKKIGFDTVEALKSDISTNMQREMDSQLQNHFKSNVLDALLEKNPINIPTALVDIEIKHMQRMTLQRMAAEQGKKDIPDIELPKDPYIAEAKKRVALGLLLAEAIKDFDIKLDQDLVRAKVESMAESYKEKEQVIAWYYKNKQMLAEVEAAVLEDQAVDKLIESANIKEVALPYKEAMEINKQG